MAIKQIASGPGVIWDILEEKPPTGLVIDIGAGAHCCPGATTVVDLTERPKGFTGDLIQADACDWHWAERFEDKHFDFVFCNHLLEDVAYPIGVLRIATRIAKRGIFGTPHWTYEAGIRGERAGWGPVSGWPHHRWFVGINKQTGAYEFMAKYSWFIQGEYEYTQANINLAWDGGDFPFADITHKYPAASKRYSLLAWLGERWDHEITDSASFALR